VQQAEAGDGYEVINLDTSEVKERFSKEEKSEADALVETLNRLEKKYAEN
jgi:hypothetical protein